MHFTSQSMTDHYYYMWDTNIYAFLKSVNLEFKCQWIYPGVNEKSSKLLLYL